MTKRPLRRAVIALLAIAGSLSPGLAQQGSVAGGSEWSKGMHSAVRLIDGGRAGTQHTAAIEIRLDGHFKTYWRTPGDSGLPPVFDWSGSRNVRAVKVSWPAPIRFDDSAGSSIGYRNAAILPLAVELADPKAPALLKLRLDYAVCEKICIPAHAEAALPLPPESALLPQAAAVRRAQAMVPKAAGLAGGGMPSLQSVSPETDGQAIMARISVPASAGIVDIFTEGPDGWTFAAPVAVATRDGPGASREIDYRINVDAMPRDARLLGLPVRLTVTADGAAIEVSTALDPAAKRQ